jgi:hypothetical protein
MIRPVRDFGWTAVLILAFSASSAAQTPPAPSTPGPVAISFLGGLASGGSSSGGTVGGTFTFDVSDRLSIETTGAYLDRGRGADGVYGNAGLLVNLLPAGSKAVPYAAVGGGIYHVSYDLGDMHILGQLDERMGSALGSIPDFRGFGQMPAMYAERLRSMIWPPPSGGWGRRSFTDPAMTIGGGVRLDLTPHLSLRPDARALFAFGDGRSVTLGMFTLNVGYRF